MRKLILTIGFIYSILPSSAQKYAEFKLPFPTQSTGTSLYNKIQLLDLRHDRTELGRVKLSSGDKDVSLISVVSLQNVLNDYYRDALPNDPGNEELVILLYEWKMIENPRFVENGFVSLSADLFGSKDGQYIHLATVDSLEILSSEEDITETLKLRGASIMTDFINSNLSNQTNLDTHIYSLQQLKEYPKIYASRYPLYQEKLANGIYLTKESFLNQTPDLPFDATIIETNRYEKDSNRINGTPILAIIAEGTVFFNYGYKIYQAHFHDQKWSFGRGLVSDRMPEFHAKTYPMIESILYSVLRPESKIPRDLLWLPVNGHIVPKKIKEKILETGVH